MTVNVLIEAYTPDSRVSDVISFSTHIKTHGQNLLERVMHAS